MNTHACEIDFSFVTQATLSARGFSYNPCTGVARIEDADGNMFETHILYEGSLTGVCAELMKQVAIRRHKHKEDHERVTPDLLEQFKLNEQKWRFVS